VSVKTSCSLDPEVPPFLYLDARQIEQVLLNLAFNARDAMPDGGLLSFVTNRVDLQTSGLVKNKYSKPGKFVKIIVSDTGTGIKPEIMDKIFDPFFTTKGEKGSGLGLSTTLGIVKNHGGWINVINKISGGTSFEIFLPVTGPDLPDDIKVERRDLTGTETILLVDDSEDVVQTITRLLVSLGYRVISALDGLDALQIVRKQTEQIDLIVADLIMPIKGGKELLDDLLEEGFLIPVLLISGYDVAKKYKVFTDGFAAFLEKPVQATRLAETIRSILDCCAICEEHR
jgi:CheY-like chemotaxis protein